MNVFLSLTLQRYSVIVHCICTNKKKFDYLYYILLDYNKKDGKAFTQPSYL